MNRLAVYFRFLLLFFDFIARFTHDIVFSLFDFSAFKFFSDWLQKHSSRNMYNAERIDAYQQFSMIKIEPCLFFYKFSVKLSEATKFINAVLLN